MPGTCANQQRLSRFRLCFQGLARRFAQCLLQCIAGGIHGLHAAVELRIDRRHESAQFGRRSTELVVLAQVKGADETFEADAGAVDVFQVAQTVGDVDGAALGCSYGECADAREGFAMMASKRCDLLQPPLPTPIGGGDSNRLAYRAPLARTGEPCGSPSEPPENGGTNDKAADPLR